MDGLVLGEFEAIPDRPDSKVTARVPVRLRSIYGSVADLGNEFIFTPTATTAYKSKKIELALVLDVTGSMSGSKIADLKVAAKELVDTLYSSNPLTGSVKVSLVPYAAAVNVGSLEDTVAHSPNDDDDCVVERDGSGVAYTDVGISSSTRMDTAENDPTDSNGHYSCPDSEIIPLTDLAIASARTSFKNKIDALDTGGYTAGHIGAAWGWYTVSPNWASVWPAASRPRPASPDVIKVVVLMTDGEFNTNYVNGAPNLDCGAPGAWAAGSGCDQALQLCQNMRSTGVALYTVGFHLDTVNSEAMLQECSGAENFYNTDTKSQLIGAFKDIVEKLTTLRITS